MHMSEVDLPNRFAKYRGDHVTLKRIDRAGGVETLRGRQ
jgi:hypothetical protein